MYLNEIETLNFIGVDHLKSVNDDKKIKVQHLLLSNSFNSFRFFETETIKTLYFQQMYFSSSLFGKDCKLLQLEYIVFGSIDASYEVLLEDIYSFTKVFHP